MNIINNIRHAAAALTGRDEKRFAIQTGGSASSPSSYLPPAIGIFHTGGSSDAGVPVDEISAMTTTAVAACVGIITDAIVSMPVSVASRAGGQKDLSHSLNPILSAEWNQYMTAATGWTAFLNNLLLWGNGYAVIERDPLGVPVALYPLRSSMVRPMRVGGQLVYLAQVGQTIEYLTPDQIFHVMGSTIDGLVGLSPIQLAKQTVGVSLAIEKFAAKFFGNGANTGGILQLPAGMKEDAIANFVASWKKNYAGTDNAFKTAMLTGDMKFTQTGTDPEKSQMVATRVHQVREIARIYRVPLHKLGDLERATFSNIEQQSIEFMQGTILPWVTRLEQEANRKILLEREKSTLQIRFDLDSLLRADTKSRYESHNLALQGGWQSINEVRAKENLAAVAGGDLLLRPLNMTAVAGGDPPAIKAA